MRSLDGILAALCDYKASGRIKSVAAVISATVFLAISSVQTQRAFAESPQGISVNKSVGSEHFEVILAEARISPNDAHRSVIFVRLKQRSAERLLDLSTRLVGQAMLMAIDDKVYSRVIVQSPITGGSLQIWVSENAEIIAKRLQTGESSLYLVPESIHD